MSKIHIEFEGLFSTREEAVEALRDAIRDVASGKWIASAPSGAKYHTFIIEVDEEAGE